MKLFCSILDKKRYENNRVSEEFSRELCFFTEHLRTTAPGDAIQNLFL